METNQTTNTNGENVNNTPEPVNTPAQAAAPKKGVIQSIKDGATAAKPKVVKVGKKLVEWTIVAATTAAVTGVALYKTYKNQQNNDGTATDEPVIDDILDDTPEEQEIPEI